MYQERTENRISSLERDMSILTTKLNQITTELREIKENQKSTDKQLLHFQESMQETRNSIDSRLFDHQKIMHSAGERISTLQSHNDEKLSEIYREMGAGFSSIQKEISLIHSDFSQVYRTIANQTKWFLTGILGAAALISMASPILQKLLQ